MKTKESAFRKASALRKAIETLTLYTFAVAQPIFDLLSRGPEFLLAHRLESTALVALVGVVSLLPPCLLILLQWLEQRLFKSSWLHALGITLLSAALALQVLKKLPATAAIVAAVVLGAGLTWALLRQPVLRRFVAILSPSILIFPAIFLFRPPISGLLFPQSSTAEEAATQEEPVVISETPIFFIVLDELPTASLMNRKRQIDERRYPAFAALAAEAHWFRNATSVAESTAYAVPAILAGRYADGPRVGSLRDYPENLFTWLGGTTYQMNVLESLTRMCPEEFRHTTVLEEDFAERIHSAVRDLRILYLHLLLPDRLTADLPDVTSTWKDFAGSETTSTNAAINPQRQRSAVSLTLAQFIESIQPTRHPVLHFLHVNLPHLPWKYLPSGKEYGPPDARLRPHGLRGEQWIDNEWATVQALQRHLLQVGYTDRVLDQLIQRLRQTGLYDRSLLIVTADHGASFWPGQSRREVSEATQADILGVPLLIKTPFQSEGVVSDRNVETIDILPTIADVLDAPLPWPVDGQSALDETLPQRREKILIDVAGSKYLGRVTFPDRIEGTNATLERADSLFGSFEDPKSLFLIGPSKELVGRKAADLPRTPSTGQEVTLSDGRIFESFDPETSYVPSRIVGSLTPGAGTDGVRDLAIAVNGTIRAVTRTDIRSNAEETFSAMVPEDAFRKGLNQVEIFQILNSDESLRLVSFPSQPVVQYSLGFAADGSATEISVSDGRSFSVDSNALQGEVVFNGMQFRGWAAKVETPRVADSILMFHDDELVARVRTGDFRRDIAERFQQGALANSGFSFVIPYSVIDKTESPLFRFFAVLGDVASPLPYRDALAPAKPPPAASHEP